MDSFVNCHDVLIAKLETRATLSAEDRIAIRQLPCKVRTFRSQHYMVREGDRPTTCSYLLGGFAFRQKLTFDGARQIVGILVPGDFTDLQQLFLREADHNVQALTQVTVAETAVDDLRALADHYPTIGKAMWIDTLIENSVTRESLLNIGRRDGPARVAHLLCEFSTRLTASGMADRGYELPFTQEQIGDATGLTSVHVNRMMKQLEREGLITRRTRSMAINNWQALKDRADYNPRYLHLDQVAIGRV